MNIKALTDNSQTVLNAIARGKVTKDAISSDLNMSISSVSGSLRSLSNRGLIETSKDGLIATTRDAVPYITAKARKVRTGTKMEQARVMFQRHYSEGRAAVLTKLRDKVGLTDKGAVTYYQSLRVEAGIAPVSLAHSGRGIAARNAKLQKTGGARSGGKVIQVHAPVH